ncbi:hypothetical protein ILUMI_23833 [Ignelater luminosus]|uniref:UBR-type domain-containing protein n=1 Tax=Ignelater luminosus TaxID=2038154 RepID=A0A8K0CA87_IGNLU|nr:hypothetical protein ILUMI_23833 [Ignelater luminosus]
MSEEHDTSMDQTVDEGDQEVVTLKDILQSEQELMDDANAVLGAIDDKKCTYSEGYMKRQALYSCLTCVPEARTDVSKAAGVCLACCLHCHEGHELIELYTKRNFRCDCGNKKFSNLTCILDNVKSSINELNQYNQNFSGVYCTCSRPYPDPEDPIEDDMIQCIICEDWYHSRHLGVEIPSQNYSEMICEACVGKHQFILHYNGMSLNKVNPSEQVEVEVVKEQSDAKGATEATDNAETSNNVEDPLKLDDDNKMEVASSSDNEQKVEEGNIEQNDNSLNNAESSQVLINNSEVCKMPKTKPTRICTKFWADVEWRNQLCTCPQCLKMYEDQKVMFLLDPQDTVHVYEEKGKAKARELEEREHEDDMKLLNSLDRVPLMEAIAGFNDMKVNLMEYLKKFAENKKVVREEDIREFFSKYDTKKKQKCEIPHYCR